MAKINIIFNDKKYSIDETTLSSAAASLQSHLSTVMNGTGAAINLGGVSYPIDSTKLDAARTEFVSALQSIAGEGEKVIIDGVEYSVDPAKIAGTISNLEVAFSSLSGGAEEERLEGDGAQYYTLAPSTLSFRSTAPLGEFQEVAVNGQVVDSSNYTLEEGSTIVKFSIDYLKTLNVGSYEVAVASDSKTVKGDFTVVAPSMSEQGIYYNQPYFSLLEGMPAIFMFSPDHIAYMLVDSQPSGEFIYDVREGTIFVKLDPESADEMPLGILSNNEFYSEMLGGITFKLGDQRCVADDEYIYTYSEEEYPHYSVSAIGVTKNKYNTVIKSNIYDYPVSEISAHGFEYSQIESIELPESIVTIRDSAFEECHNLTNVTLGNSVKTIERSAFWYCDSLVSIVIPDSVATIGKMVFEKCDSLSEITLPFVGASKDGTDNTHFGYLFGADEYKEHGTHVPAIKKVTITSATKIDSHAFYLCSSLTSVTIPDSVTSIGSDAFDCCSSLTDITFNGTVQQWNNIEKSSSWYINGPATYVQCADGQVAL